MARRYQKGQLLLRGKNKDVWYGRWREDVQRPDGSWHRACRNEKLGTKAELPTRRLAQRKLDEFLDKVNDLDYKPASNLTLQKFAETWLAEVLQPPAYKPASIRSMGSMMRNHVMPFFGPLLLSEISTQNIHQFVQHLNGKLMPRSVHLAYATLQQMWMTAMAWGKVQHDPFEKRRRGFKLPKVTDTDREPFTEEEMRQLIAAAPEPDRSLYALMAETGLRVGEALALQVRDIDFVKGEVRVRKNWNLGQMGTPKSEKGNREPSLSPELLAHLHQRLAAASGTDYLITGRDKSQPLGYTTFKDRLYRLCDQLGIPRHGFHGIRYLNATVAIAEGVDVKTLQTRLGHSRPEITLRLYARFQKKNDQAIAAKLGAKFAPKCAQIA